MPVLVEYERESWFYFSFFFGEITKDDGGRATPLAGGIRVDQVAKTVMLNALSKRADHGLRTNASELRGKDEVSPTGCLLTV